MKERKKHECKIYKNENRGNSLCDHFNCGQIEIFWRKLKINPSEML